MAPLNQLIDPQLAALLQAAAAADSSTPNFFQVSSTGQSEANFQGKIIAEGLELTETTVESPVNTIEWLDNLLNRREGISAFRIGTTHLLQLFAGKPRAEGGSVPAIGIEGSDLENQGQIIVEGGGTPSTLAVLFDSSGFGSFMRHKIPSYAEGATGLMSYGVAQVFFNGVSNVSNAVVVSHGLGVTPRMVHVEPSAGFQGETLTGEKQAPNVTNFEARLRFVSFVPAAGLSSVYWLAIG